MLASGKKWSEIASITFLDYTPLLCLLLREKLKKRKLELNLIVRHQHNGFFKFSSTLQDA